MKNVLIACEESQRTCLEFRKLGFNSYSCDVQECSGGHPEYHIMQDVLPLLNGKCSFKTMDNKTHYIDKWDLIIAHPPCTNLAVSGMRWFKEGRKDKKLINEGAEFFMKFVNANCEHICIENPVCVMSTIYRKPDQIINPWMFGEMQQKKTCLWLKNLPLLKQTNNVYSEMMKLPVKERTMIWQLGSNHSKERSKTFMGIAKAFAEQYSDYLLHDEGIFKFEGNLV